MQSVHALWAKPRNLLRAFERRVPGFLSLKYRWGTTLKTRESHSIFFRLSASTQAAIARPSSPYTVRARSSMSWMVRGTSL
jgi:hypothetical protein